MRVFNRVAIAGGLAVAAMTVSTGAALADPPSALTPARTDIVGVGSDTTQGVLNHIAAGYNAQPAGSGRLYSFDATGPSPITTKQDCAPITRPNGSSAGISALAADAAVPPCIDFARSSRPKKTDGTEDGLAFLAMAKDGVTWAAQATTNAPATLSAAQLASVYSCTAPPGTRSAAPAAPSSSPTCLRSARAPAPSGSRPSASPTRRSAGA